MNTSHYDLKNQLKFLGFEHIEKTFLALHYPCTINNKMLMNELIAYFLRPIMMRHSHEQKYRGTSTTLMSLPPKVSYLEFSQCCSYFVSILLCSSSLMHSFQFSI